MREPLGPVRMERADQESVNVLTGSDTVLWMRSSK
jgi:hypothetical protein